MADALTELTRNGGAGLPVAPAGRQVSGWLTHHDLLRAAAAVGRQA